MISASGSAHSNPLEAVAVVCYLDGDEVTATSYFTGETISAADVAVAELFNKEVSTVADLGDQVITIYWPVTKLVIAGMGPNAEALSKAVQTLGWQVVIEPRYEMGMGLMAGLSKMDCAVILGHLIDVDKEVWMARLGLMRAALHKTFGSITIQSMLPVILDHGEEHRISIG
jgi:hypothetical protein